MEHIEFMVYKAMTFFVAAFLYGLLRGWRGF